MHARQPVTDHVVKVRPMGKAPKGMKWDADAGDWVSVLNAGCFKRKVPDQTRNPPENDENSQPRGRPKRTRCM